MQRQSNETSPALLKLHRNIRLQQWQEVYDALNQDHFEPIVLQENKIGWTSVHFTALHGAPDILCWKWILSRVLEDYHEFMRSIEEGDHSDCYLDYSVNPYFRRTQAGHSPTDLFFAKRLHVSVIHSYHIVQVVWLRNMFELFIFVFVHASRLLLYYSTTLLHVLAISVGGN